MVDVLGISCFYHDSAACLIRDGNIVAAAEEERFTRKKHDSNFPTNAIDFCLKEGGIRGEELDFAVFYEKPFLKFERVLLGTLAMFPRSWRVFNDAMLTWMKDKLWVKSTIKEALGIADNKILFVEHHVAHAASAYFCSPFDEAAIVTVDGVGEWVTATMGYGKGNEITLTREIKYPHSLGLLYSAFTAFLGFEVNEGEYKVMGMAPYGEPKHKDKVYKLININTDGSFSLNMEYFSYHYSHDKTFSDKFVELFGEPHDPRESEELLPYYADMAASIQEVTEEVLLRIMMQTYNETGQKNLCLSGGVALNSKANGRILRETPFEEIYIQPAAGDSGGAMGAALYVYRSLLKNKRSPTLRHVYFGKGYSEIDIKEYLVSSNIPFEYFSEEKKLLDYVTDRLMEGSVAGWYQGRFEWGPRALGNRSILADTRREEMKDVVNRKIKFREPFRPFAPAVLAERANEFFDLPDVEKHYPARFMLYVVPVRKEKRIKIPAVTHVDGSARIQIVFKEDNPRYYNLIEKFGEKTDVPVVLNTSFNLKGEPIVNSPDDAYKTFARSGMDLLIMGKFVVEKSKNSELGYNSSII